MSLEVYIRDIMLPLTCFDGSHVASIYPSEGHTPHIMLMCHPMHVIMISDACLGTSVEFNY